MMLSTLHSYILRVVLVSAAISALSSSYATTYAVDDSASQPVDATTPMRWRSLSPTRGDDHVIEGAARVNIRLNTQAWVGRVGRIYMTLPPQSVGQVEVEWATQGKLLPGKLLSGQRSLVYSGKIIAARIEDLILVTIRSDGRLLAAPQRLRFSFEIDLE